jgi:hypothetical protein
VCGAACRARRRNRLARRRRRADLDEQRVDERARQHKHRKAAREARCHELAADPKPLELQSKLREIVDKVAAASRASFRREAMQILRKFPLFVPAKVDGAGVRHELPSALEAAENGRRSVVHGDDVTSQHGSG